MRNKKKKAKDNGDEGAATKDVELPDDFSIFGGSSVASSTMGGLGDNGSFTGGHCDGGDDADGGGGDANAAAANRAAKLDDQLTQAWTFLSEKRSAKREAGYRVLFSAVTQLAAGPG